MDITKLKNNDYFYKDYADDFEPKLIIRLKNKPEYNLAIWEGYVDDILDMAKCGIDGWKGFTKDNQEVVRTFDSNDPVQIETTEYLNDLKNYEKNEFKFDESKECLYLMINFLEYAQATNSLVEAWIE